MPDALVVLLLMRLTPSLCIPVSNFYRSGFPNGFDQASANAQPTAICFRINVIGFSREPIEQFRFDRLCWVSGLPNYLIDETHSKHEPVPAGWWRRTVIT